MAKSDITIVGGGISGVSLAYYCASHGMSVRLLDRDARPGGAMHSHRSDEGAYWLEMGAHTCYNSYGNLIGIMDACGMLGELMPRKSVPFKVLADGEVKSLFGKINYVELLLSLPRAAWLRRADATVEEFYGGILGRGNYERLFRHFFNAVPSQETDQFPADLLFKSRPRRKDVLRSYTLAGGLQSIGERVVEASGIEFVAGADVQAIQRDGSGFTVITAAGAALSSTRLALALPAPAAARLLQPLDAKLAAEIAAIETATVHSAGVIVRRERLAVPEVAGIISPGDLFYSAVSRDTVEDPRYRGFTFHFKPEVTDANRRIARICEVLQIDAMAIEEVATRENILPSLRRGHEARALAMDVLLTDPCLLVTGNYFGGVAIEDCVTRSRREFDRMVAG